MRCPRCQQDSPSSAKFCPKCGARLTPVCAGCGTNLPVGARFCLECGQPVEGTSPPQRNPEAYTPKHLAEKILTSRAALEGERKQVTVLFADVKGSMELAEQLGPEEWHGIMERFFQLLAEGVHRFEGTVNQFTGDGIMALFGAPIAHEDHAQRACWAALHVAEALRGYAQQLRRARGLDFAVRIGVNSGEVVVGKIGDDLRMDYTAQSHTVGLAQRMEQLAEAGRIYLTEHTAALVGGFFQLEDLGPFTVKGVREPLRIHALGGVGPLRTRLDVSRVRGFSRFVGRDDEMAALELALAGALAGSAQVVGVVAEPGVGKSRLVYEFAQRCRARGVAVHEAHGVAHGKLIPFLPVLELLRGYFGVTEQDSDDAARRKIAGTLVLLDEGFRDALPLLFEFLGVPDPERPAPRTDSETRQRELLAIMKRLIHVASQRAPGVILVEDLHWIDGGSEAFLESLVEGLPGSRAPLLVTFRPEYHAGWMQRSNYQQLPLLPLSDAASAELLRDLLGTDTSLAWLGNHVRARTGGNPFFIEEAVQSLVESGVLDGVRGAYRLTRAVHEVAIPATVQAVLAARIDRLGEREKVVLETAAVIGKDFAEPILERVVELPEPELAAALRALVSAEFLYERALHPEAEYAFKHPLTQEVAYRSQLAERRARVHAAVARVVADLYGGKLDERAALLAHHWEGAGEALEAARWSRHAAEWVSTSNFPEALRHWRKVRELLVGLPESAETRELAGIASAHIFGLGVRVGMSGEEPARLLAGLKTLAEESRDLRLQAIFAAAPAAAGALGGAAEEAIEPLQEAVRLADGSDDAGLQLALRAVLVLALFLTGRLREGLAITEPALARTPADPQLGAEVFGFNPFIMLLLFRAMLLREIGRLDEAARELDRTAQLTQERGQLEILSLTHQSYVDLARITGDVRRAMEHARRAVEAAEALGSAFSRAQAYGAIGGAHMLNEEWDEAASAIEQSLAIIRESRTGASDEAFKVLSLAEVYLHQGKGSLARATAEEAIALARRSHARLAECSAHLVLARVLLGTEGARGASAIASALAQALALVEETGAAAVEPFIRLEEAELARATGDEATRQRKLREAHRLFTEMGAPIRAEQVARELGASVESPAGISSTSRT
jgi:class 3 adenylate cyclase/tetratricopeptide (TPR) repeat protein